MKRVFELPTFHDEIKFECLKSRRSQKRRSKTFISSVTSLNLLLMFAISLSIRRLRNRADDENVSTQSSTIESGQHFQRITHRGRNLWSQDITKNAIVRVEAIPFVRKNNSAIISSVSFFSPSLFLSFCVAVFPPRVIRSIRVT